MSISTPARLHPRFALIPAVAGLAAIAGLLAGCSENPANKSTPAEVSTPAPAGSSKPAANARKFVFTEDSFIGFVGSKVTGKHSGGFKKLSGQFFLAGSNLSGSGHKVVIDMTTTWADEQRLAGHLISPDFFDVAKFPESVFELTNLEKTADGGSKLTGNLTLHGVTKQISFPADVQVQGDQATLKAEFFIKRFDFGIKFPGKANDLIRDEVVIKLDLKAKATG
jgi:polyisoprenoid-binding protein YceI